MTPLTVDGVPSHTTRAPARVVVAQHATLLLVALLFTLPFLLPIHRLPQPAFDSEWLAAILLSGLALALAAGRRVEATLQWPLPAWLVAMMAIAGAQYATGQLHYAQQPILACLYAIAILGAYWTGRTLLAARMLERTAVTIAWALVVGAVLSAAIQWLQLLEVKGLPPWLFLEIVDSWYRTRPVANLGQVNLLATYFIWALFAILFLVHRRLLPTGLAIGLAFVLAVGLAITRSRTGFVFSLGLLASLWLPWALRPDTRKKRAIATLTLVVGYIVGATVVASFVAYQGAGVDNALQRFNETGGFAIRLLMWSDALKVAATAPFFGVGFADYAAHQYWIAQPSPHMMPAVYVHDVVLQTAAELGWPMALALTGMGAWWALARWRERAADPATALAWALMLILGAHSLLEWPLELMHLAIPAGLFFALAEPPVTARGRAFIDSRLLVALGIAGIVQAVPMKLEFDEIVDVADRVDTERRTAKGVDEGTIQRMLALAESARLRTYADGLLVFVRAPGAVEGSEEEIRRHERLLIIGAEPRLVARLVIVNAKAGRMDEALRHAERLRVFHRGQYPEMKQMILSAIAPLGAAAAPLAQRLEEGGVGLK